MRTDIKIIVAIIFVTLAALILLPIILLSFKISIDPFDKYISAVGSVIVILLMLVTIILTENATTKQIESWKKWELIRRKQSIKSLINEFKLNISIYKDIEKKSQREKTDVFFNNFVLTSLENCLNNPPIDNEKINNYLLRIYDVIKTHDNKISATRIPNITEESKSDLFSKITNDFIQNKKIMNNNIKWLEEYEKNLKFEDN